MKNNKIDIFTIKISNKKATNSMDTFSIFKIHICIKYIKIYMQKSEWILKI